jgi:threonyl-tRNA synthetase
MIHRAILGSYERFLAILLEHFNGNLPFWISPVQVKVIPVAETHYDKAKEIRKSLKEKGWRVEIDEEDDSFGKKIRKAKKEKVPYFIILGDDDIGVGKVTLEERSGQSSQITLEEVIQKFEGEK